MSGGHFDYKQHHIRDIVEKIEVAIANNKSSNFKFYKKTIKQFQSGIKALRIAEVYAQRIDWLLSYDDSEESFHERLKSDLKEIK